MTRSRSTAETSEACPRGRVKPFVARRPRGEGNEPCGTQTFYKIPSEIPCRREFVCTFEILRPGFSPRAPKSRHGRAVDPAIHEHRLGRQHHVQVVPMRIVRWMNASRGTMAQTVFMDGRDNRPAL